MNAAISAGNDVENMRIEIRHLIFNTDSIGNNPEIKQLRQEFAKLLNIYRQRLSNLNAFDHAIVHSMFGPIMFLDNTF